MPPRDYLPQLPLMLAAIPRAIGELLRDAGVPATPLPEMPLGINSVGRFVLFDSRSTQSQSRARRAAGQGLELIDLAGFARQRGVVLFSHQQRVEAHEIAKSRADFLHWLKRHLEERGGVWMRISDFPFPYRSALCVSVSHPTHDPQILAEHAAALGQHITQFVPADRGNEQLLKPGNYGQLGVHLDSPRWESGQLLPSLREFSAAGHRLRGILSAATPQPEHLSRELWRLGVRMACRSTTRSWYRNAHSASQEPWMLFGLVSPTADGSVGTGTLSKSPPPVGPQDSFESRLTAHYHVGSPLFVHADSSRFNIECWGFHDSQRNPWPLLWRTPLGEFARWLRWRRTMTFQVRRMGNLWEIATPSAQGRFACALELWKGSHMAFFPFKGRQISIAEDGLAFVQQTQRSPVGIMPEFRKDSEGPQEYHSKVA